MTISQAILWAASNVEPEKKSSEIAAAEPYFIGSHSGASGAWVSGPEDLQTEETKKEYFWGYSHMSTVKGMFCAGDASGASSHISRPDRTPKAASSASRRSSSSPRTTTSPTSTAPRWKS
jgi:succinate dehydrogenase/fumarate reductase flavoprotein subunit